MLFFVFNLLLMTNFDFCFVLKTAHALLVWGCSLLFGLFLMCDNMRAAIRQQCVFSLGATVLGRGPFPFLNMTAPSSTKRPPQRSGFPISLLLFSPEDFMKMQHFDLMKTLLWTEPSVYQIQGAAEFLAWHFLIWISLAFKFQVWLKTKNSFTAASEQPNRDTVKQPAGTSHQV